MPRQLLLALVVVSIAGACATGQTGDDDDGDDDSHGGGFATGTTTGTATGGGTATAVGGSTSTGSGVGTATGAGTASGTGTGSGSSGVCYNGYGACNPMQTGCSTGEACDLDSDTLLFVCYPPPNNAGLGAPCDAGNPSGPFCQNGLTCVSDTACATGYCCKQYCCTAADCPGTDCVELTVGPPAPPFSLNVCD